MGLNVGKIGQTPAQVAQSSNARDVIKVLQDWGKERKEVEIVKIVVDGAGFKELNQEYVATSADEIPTGFEWVCRQKGSLHRQGALLGPSTDWMEGPWTFWTAAKLGRHLQRPLKAGTEERASSRLDLHHI